MARDVYILRLACAVQSAFLVQCQEKDPEATELHEPIHIAEGVVFEADSPVVALGRDVCCIFILADSERPAYKQPRRTLQALVAVAPCRRRLLLQNNEVGFGKSVSLAILSVSLTWACKISGKLSSLWLSKGCLKCVVARGNGSDAQRCE